MKKKVFLVLYIIVALVILSTNVYAALTANISLTADKASVKAGEDVIVSLTISNMSSAISSVKGYIDVDENVLSAPSEAMIVKNSDNKIEVITDGTVSADNKLSFAYAPTTLVDKDVIFNTSSSATEGHDIYFTEDFKSDLPKNKDSVILKMKFTVKAGTANGNFADAVKIVGLTAESSTMENGTATTEKVENLSANLTVTVNDGTTPTQPTNNTSTGNQATNNTPANTTQQNTANTSNTATPTNTNTNTNKNNTAANNTTTNTNTNSSKNNTNTNKNTNVTNANTNTNKDNTVSASKIPATGARSFIIPGILICLLGFISYKKYMDYKEVK